MSLETLLEKTKAYNFPQASIDSAELGRLEFASKFPLERIGSLTIDEYSLGTDKDSFSYWLEFKKTWPGVGGGTAFKFGLFKRRKDGKYYGGSANNNKVLHDEELKTLFHTIISGIQTALDYTRDDHISEIKNLNVPLHNMILQKILCIYYPNKFLSIIEVNALIDLANDIKLTDIDINRNNLIEINYECNKFLRSIPELKDWNYYKLGSFIWENYRKDKANPSADSDVKTKVDNSSTEFIEHPSPLNTILFGPPGTGKTFNTINLSVKIANHEFDLTNHRTDIKKEFDRLMNDRQIVFTTFHQSMSYEDFIEGIKPQTNDKQHVIYSIIPGVFKTIASVAKDNWFGSEPEPKKNYVLIIDEINRGNVSQIFGELITLIEEDKRLGRAEALEITLPYSKEKFGVPPNLYIIGTMNTADRSVEALDAALRRRFSFQEMPPDPDLIATAGRLAEVHGILESIDLPALLRTINRRIEQLLDKDHQIGHSYFMEVTSITVLKTVFQNRIIPLLQEYFFGDYGKIGLVLGNGFVESPGTGQEAIFAGFSDYDPSGFAERRIYRLKRVTDDDEFISALNTLLETR